MSGSDANSQNGFVTEATEKLNELLVAKGLKTTLEYFDGHKHVDIALLNEHIFIEVDGLHHFTDAEQIERDFKRNHYSDGDDFDTIHIPNIVITHHAEEVAEAIAELVSKRKID